MAQGRVYANMRQATVVDAATGGVLAYVHVVSSTGKGVITNKDGQFSIEAAEDAMLRFSCVGYEARNIRAGELPDVVRMKQLTISLKEVTVLSISSILAKVEKKLNDDYAVYKGKDRTYFNRTTVTDGVQNELIECCVRACSSVNARGLKVLNGNFWGRNNEGEKIEPSLIDTDLHRFASLGPLIRDNASWDFLMVPFSVNPQDKFYSKYYDAENEVLEDEDGKMIYRITLKQRMKQQVGILSGVLYVDVESFELLRFDGAIHGMNMHVARKQSRQAISADVDLHIEYSHDSGFTEMNSISSVIDLQGITAHAVFMTISDSALSATEGLPVKKNLLETIRLLNSKQRAATFPNVLQRTKQEEFIIMDDERDSCFNSISH